MSLYPAYASLADARSYLRVTDAEDTADDATISLALETASRAIDRATNRQFGLGASAAARVYTASWDKVLRRHVVQVDDLMTSTGLEVNGSAAEEGTFDTAYSSFRLYPFNAADAERPWTHIIFPSGVTPSCALGAIEVTAKWGWLVVPDTIENACLLQATRLVKRRDAPFGVAGSPDMGNELRLLAKLDPDVEVMVAAYRRWWGAV